MSIKDTNVTTLTGATGFLGSQLMASLLEKGCRLIILGRGNENESLELRIKKLLKWYNINNSGDQLRIIETNFLKPFLGLSEKQYKKLCSESGQIIHCASDTSFSECNRERVFSSNLESLNEILRFADDSNAEFFHYISTAYSSGIGNDAIPEKLVTAPKYNNVYEESKAAAEKYVFEYCSAVSVPFTILRPSIVYGNSQTGRSIRFNALYNHIKSIQFIRDIYLNDIKKHNGLRSAKVNVYIDDNGILNMPLRISLPKDGFINLIPVDYFVDAAISIIDNAADKTIYHITAATPMKISALSDYCERYLKIKGIEISFGSADKHLIQYPHEELFDRFIEPYRPYLSDKRIFEMNNTNKVLGNISPPHFSYEIFGRCMDYAISVDWGKNIFN